MTKIPLRLVAFGLAGLLTGCGIGERRLEAGESVHLPGDITVSRHALQLRYRGEISAQGVQAVHALSEGRRIDELVIASSGGEINAGMDLGEWVHGRGVTVVVDEYCLSSCANYVFPAAWQKVLAPGAVVAWHGSARQRDLPEQLMRVVDDQIKALSLPAAATEQERTRRRQAASAYLKHSISRQDEFFRRIGVSEFITRIGRERHGIEGLYSMSVADMGRFGIVNVVAPVGDAGESTEAVQQRLEVRIEHLKLDDTSMARSP